MRRPLVGDERLDAALAQLLPFGFGGIGPVPVHRLGPAAWVPRFAPHGGMASTNGSSWVTSLVFALVTLAARGMPWPSVTMWCLLPNLLRSVGLGPVFSPPPKARANDASTVARAQSILSAPRSSESKT